MEGFSGKEPYSYGSTWTKILKADFIHEINHINSCICLDVLYSFCSYLSYNQLHDLSPGLFGHSTWVEEDK